ncbi:hypothetical protein J4Q44_G00325810 [Coregonus suidteri]|uniref:Mastermind-like protein 2 n=1 Tax=Coregonus suidteri TaxID=861788 RepID=A0AAN8KKH5_9TELE
MLMIRICWFDCYSISKLQGSLRRKIEGHTPGYSKQQNGLSCGPSGLDFKRVRLEGGSGGLGGHGPCSFSSGQSQSMGGSASSIGHTLNRKNNNSSYMMPHGVVNSDLINMTLKEMKKEPIDHVTSCGQRSTEMMVFDFKDEVGSSQIDPELQDLFDELTKTVPSLNDLEFEKMLKQDDTFGLVELERGASTLCSHLEKPIKMEYSSPDYGQTHGHGGSSQLRPASAGPSFTMSSSSPITNQKSQGQGPSGLAGPPSRGLPGWPEVSHAAQLKQMAANQNQQQPKPQALLHHQHPAGPGSSWDTQPSSSSFPQDKLSNPASMGQRITPQTSMDSQGKSVNNCLFKPNGHNGSSHLDMKVLSNKPMLHFSPKASQQPPTMAGPLNKTTAHQQQQQQQQQPSTSAQNLNQNHPVHNYQNPQQQLPMSGSPHLQPKALAQRTPLSVPGSGLHFKLSQQRQMPPGPRLPTNGSLVGMSAQPQSQANQRPPVPGSNTQQKPPGPGKTQVMQRQLSQQQHIINDSDKSSSNQDPFNRHLTRPPPDYKQPRGMIQPTGLFTGMNSSQSLSTNGPDQIDLPSMSCHMPSGPGSKMTPPPTDWRFGSGPHPHQLQQHNNQTKMGLGVGGGLNQNKSRFPGPPNGQGNGFEVGGLTSVQHPTRTSVGQQGGGMPSQGQGQGLGGVMGWPPGAKPPIMGPGPGSLGVRRLPNSLQPQGGQSRSQLDMSSHQYSLGPRHIGPGPPNQVAPDIGMLPPNPALRSSTTNPRPSQPMMPPLPGLPSLNQASPEQRVPAGGSTIGVFPPHNHNPGGSTIGVFPPHNHNPGGSYQTQNQNSRAVNRLTFEFLQEGDNTVPGINTDSDFIDSLLKSGSGNDDWMKDINLDEILGSHS